MRRMKPKLKIGDWKTGVGWNSSEKNCCEVVLKRTFGEIVLKRTVGEIVLKRTVVENCRKFDENTGKSRGEKQEVSVMMPLRATVIDGFFCDFSGKVKIHCAEQIQTEVFDSDTGRGKDIIICNVSSAVDKKKRFLKGCLLALCCLCFNVFGNSLFFSLKRSGMQVQYDCVSSLFISSLLLLLYSRFLQNGHGSSMINDEYGNIKQAKVPFTFSEKTCLCGFAPPKLQSRASYVWLQYKLTNYAGFLLRSYAENFL
ncbi:hypothetical protein OUZ56_018987 [Daphnia magna]|uniref:Uncharacterized protein n=1 Tax=Daphnia magna TaxID=35525 RepID=A0ABQ9ZAB7_9CRUS|nr:hypothetical protein OUZ56_018987 [Daphnia magna]